MQQLSNKDKIRFWDRVLNLDSDDCWPWLGGLNGHGYGLFQLNKKSIYAHRIAYYLEYDTDPGKLLVCHHCDNPLCCNPKHLFLGTIKDNTQNASRKGRLDGRNNHVKLTEEDVSKIRQLLNFGIKNMWIAEMFNVCRSTISKIKCGKNWS